MSNGTAQPIDFDTLLGLIHRREASEMTLVAGAAPQVVVGLRTSRLALPAVGAEWLREQAATLMGPDRSAALKSGQPVTFAYPLASVGRFEVTVAGTLDEPRISVRPELDRASATLDPELLTIAPEEGLVAPPELREALTRAVAMGASDIHLGDGDPPMLRLHGKLQPMTGVVVAAMPVRPLAEAMLTPLGRRRLSEGGAVDFSFSIEGIGRFRANVYRAVKGWNLAIRSLPERIPNLQDLRMPGSLVELAEFRDGLVLFTGPTGSGKSATMAALVEHVNNTRPCKIITLEDPIEFVHPRRTAVVRQREVGVHVASFADGLRDALREDPDVILVGEMRDLETIGLAITAAETGHLVFSTLHSNRAASAVDRMVDVFPEHRQAQIRLQLADCLRAVVAQRLLPQADGRGRVPAVEVMRVNHAIANNVREKRAHQIGSVMQTHREEGMWVFERHLAALVKKNLITLDVAKAHAGDMQLFDTYLRG